MSLHSVLPPLCSLDRRHCLAAVATPCLFVLVHNLRSPAQCQQPLPVAPLAVQVKEYVPPPPDAADAPPTDLSLDQLRREGQAKQQALENWCRTAYGEVRGRPEYRQWPDAPVGLCSGCDIAQLRCMTASRSALTQLQRQAALCMHLSHCLSPWLSLSHACAN